MAIHIFAILMGLTYIVSAAIRELNNSNSKSSFLKELISVTKSAVSKPLTSNGIRVLMGSMLIVLGVYQLC